MNDRTLTYELPAEDGGSLPPLPESEESLVADARAGLSPSQMVDRQLDLLLQSTQLPVNPLDRFAPTVTE